MSPRSATALAVLLLALVAPAPAAAQRPPDLTYCSADPCEPLPLMGWEGAFRSQRVELKSKRTGAVLRGTVFAPPAAKSRRRGHPLVVIVPGSGGSAREENYHWSARELAANGYVVLGVDPQGIGRSDQFGETPCDPAHSLDDPEYPYPCPGAPYQQRPNFDDAALSGIDYGLGRANPFARLVDARHVGVAGHSLGAAAASSAQARDPRVDAIVAWDGLDADEMSMDQNAPTHHAVNGHVPADGMNSPTPVNAPALGLHAESETTSPYDRDPAKRTRGWAHWRAAGMPSMVIAFRGTTHLDFAQEGQGNDHLRTFEWFTRAWFDVHLKRRRTAYRRLLAPEVLGVARRDMLSQTWRSAAYLPAQGIDCADLLGACPDLRAR